MKLSTKREKNARKKIDSHQIPIIRHQKAIYMWNWLQTGSGLSLQRGIMFQHVKPVTNRFRLKNESRFFHFFFSVLSRFPVLPK
jgi:hypothetical protein